MSELHSNLAETLSRVCDSGPTPAGLPGHDVHFYSSEESLVRSVVAFLSAGVRVGQPLIVIATEPHRKAFAAGLREKGLDPDEILAGRVVLWLDARETLNAFMEDRLPSPELFEGTVGNVFEKIVGQRQYLVVRAFGEMVDLLFKDGNIEGAVALEELWNELAAKYKYSLLCAYSIENFLHESGVADFRRVCDQHTNALPLDTFKKNVA
ncbi:MAG TPA: MEDS domain-containing protein [Gemmatimonadaceae bacterium]|nr:MEDS domain-containing protein [Gemmatimonadaceae bacterium]